MSNRKDSWFKWVIDRWRARRNRLTLEARGLLADLINEWRDGKTVPDDPREIAAEIGIRDWRSVARPLAELKKLGRVSVRDGLLFNPETEDEIAERTAQRRRKADDEDGNSGQGSLPLPPTKPRLVHDTGDKVVRACGRVAEMPISRPTDADQSADSRASRARKSLIYKETGFASENPELRNQRLLLSPSLVAARARGDPTSAPEARQGGAMATA